jgi:hypothetical protein
MHLLLWCLILLVICGISWALIRIYRAAEKVAHLPRPKENGWLLGSASEEVCVTFSMKEIFTQYL